MVFVSACVGFKQALEMAVGSEETVLEHSVIHRVTHMAWLDPGNGSRRGAYPFSTACAAAAAAVCNAGIKV